MGFAVFFRLFAAFLAGFGLLRADLGAGFFAMAFS
jgi:hypothetical protein